MKDIILSKLNKEMRDRMNLGLYTIIFCSKVIENALATLRLIVVANGKKWLGAILQFAIALVWVIATGMVVINITKDPFKILAFALGSFVGSFVGSLIEEKMALGNNMLLAIVDSHLSDIIVAKLKEKPYSVSVIDGTGKEKNKSLLFIMATRKNQKEVVHLIKVMDTEAKIIAQNATELSGNLLYK